MSAAPIGIDQATWQDALWRFWSSELEALDVAGIRPDWNKRRIAATELCKMIGLADLVQAISGEGALRPPPAWPAVDVVPIGGGPGLILCEVRTVANGRKYGVRIGLKRGEGARLPRAFDTDQIGEAVERGKFELRRKLAMSGAI